MPQRNNLQGIGNIGLNSVPLSTLLSPSPIQTLTVGSGIAPDQPRRARGLGRKNNTTAGKELHLSLKENHFNLI